MVLDLNRDAHVRGPMDAFVTRLPGGSSASSMASSGAKATDLGPYPKRSGMSSQGRNPVAAELACARMMGFDYNGLPC